VGRSKGGATVGVAKNERQLGHQDPRAVMKMRQVMTLDANQGGPMKVQLKYLGLVATFIVLAGSWELLNGDFAGSERLVVVDDDVATGRHLIVERLEAAVRAL
jgi:hypothetical protein